MSGFAGFAGSISPAEGETLLGRMLSTLQGDGAQSRELYCAQGVGLGRVTLDFQSKVAQPAWNEAKSVCVLLLGELCGMAQVRQRLLTAGHQFASYGDAELIAHLYEECGDSFVDHLNGCFAGAIWQPQSEELILFNDVIGSRSLYYARVGDRIAFSSGVRALLADPYLPRTMDAVAIAQLLQFEHMLDSRTYLAAVKVLTPATVMHCCRGEVTATRTYCHLVHAPAQQYSPEAELLEQLYVHLVTAFQRQAPGELPAGINLSGGLDSRVLLALWLQCADGTPMNTFTFGIPGSDDVRLAGELAAISRSAHQYVPLLPDFVQEAAEQCVRRTDGMKSCVHMHAYSLVPAQRQRIQLVYTGFLLDVLSTTDLPAEYYGTFDSDTGIALLRRSLQTVFRDASAAEMYTDEFLGSIRQEYDDQFRALALEVKDPLFPNWHSNFELRHSESRFTQLGNDLLRGALICRTPFSDRDLIEACLAVPVGMRQGRHWLRRIVVRYAPKLAKVPWDRTGLPLEETLRAVSIRIDRQSRWYLRNLGAKWVAPPQRKSYQNYAQWLRRDMQPWVESVLLSPTALARGILNPQFQQRLVADHMQGADYARELGVLLAMELWHRTYID